MNKTKTNSGVAIIVLLVIGIIWLSTSGKKAETVSNNGKTTDQSSIGLALNANPGLGFTLQPYDPREPLKQLDPSTGDIFPGAFPPVGGYSPSPGAPEQPPIPGAPPSPEPPAPTPSPSPSPTPSPGPSPTPSPEPSPAFSQEPLPSPEPPTDSYVPPPGTPPLPENPDPSNVFERRYE